MKLMKLSSKMTGMCNIMFSLAIISVVTPYVSGIKCWNCRSDFDPKCGYPFDNSTLPIKYCEEERGIPHSRGIGPRAMCLKITQKVNGVWRYFRDCAYVNELGILGELGIQSELGIRGEMGIQGDQGFCHTTTGTDNIYLEYCTCSGKDGCNSSYMITPPPIMLILLVGLVCFVKLFA